MVSIIVPIYNSGKYIKFCINSLLEQTFTDIEILLIDDGSTDDSFYICNEFAKIDNRVKVFHKNNEGVSVARNFGIKKATGEYFVCVDSDDYVEKNYIYELIKAKKKFPEVKHIWCGFQTVSDYKGSNKHTYVSGKNRYNFFYRNQIMDLHKMWLDNSPCNKLYDTNYVKKNQIYMKDGLSLGEDLLFNYLYLDYEVNENILIVNKPLYNYVLYRNDSLDHKYYDHLLEIFDRNNYIIFSYLQKWNVNNHQMQLFNNNCFYQYERVFKNTMSASNKVSFFKKISQNNSILNSHEFKNIYKNFNGYMHPLYKFAYATKNYFVIWSIEKIVKIKHKFNKKD